MEGNETIDSRAQMEALMRVLELDGKDADGSRAFLLWPASLKFEDWTRFSVTRLPLSYPESPDGVLLLRESEDGDWVCSVNGVSLFMDDYHILERTRVGRITQGYVELCRIRRKWR